MKSDQLLGPMFAKYRNAAGWAAHYELALRMLANKTPAIASCSMNWHLKSVEKEVREHFAKQLTQRDEQLFDHICEARNKLLHSDLPTALSELEKLGHVPGKSRVLQSVLPEHVTVAAIVAAIETAVPMAGRAAGDTIFGWFLHLNDDGALESAASIFMEAVSLITRLAELP